MYGACSVVSTPPGRALSAGSAVVNKACLSVSAQQLQLLGWFLLDLANSWRCDLLGVETEGDQMQF